MSNDKIKIGWFSFSCSEDSTIVFTELMNEHWRDWKKIFDFRHARVLQSKNILDELDIAFIEGAITSDEQAEQLKEIRQKSKKLVAVGACAVQGMPAGQRNLFDEKQKEEIEALIARFSALPKVLRVSEVVKVDAEVPGCPMDPAIFIKVTNNLVKSLAGIAL
jgi:coenzyme F420-reducing hydrogenase gamma subunit